MVVSDRQTPVERQSISTEKFKQSQARKTAAYNMQVGRCKFERPQTQDLRAIIQEELQSLRQELQDSIEWAIAKAILESVAPLRGTLERMEKRLEEQGSKMRDLEDVISNHSDRVVDLEAEVALLRETCKTLRAKVDEQENASRRQNLQKVGLPEMSGRRKCTSYVSKMLEGLVAEGVLDKPPDVDRAHRSLRKKPKVWEQPWALIVRLHKFVEREKVLRWAKEKHSCD